VSADVDQLEQLLMILAVNARDAMAAGGRLSIAVGLRPRDAAAGREGLPVSAEGYASLAVRDTGCGMAAPVLARIYEPFFTTKPDGLGAGLGLATARDIVRRHDGWIEVESKVGVGTQFQILLPLVRAAAPSPASPAPGTPQKAGRGTLLLVEDEAGVRDFAAAVLRQDGYTLLMAKSGENALEVWGRHSARIDLLLTDVVLPGEISGPGLAAMLQAEKPALRVILTSGYDLDAGAPRAAGAAAPLVLGKPYTPRALLRAVGSALA
jgi:two-component system cell cycle sensor histidine kinase/response regulator CckA